MKDTYQLLHENDIARSGWHCSVDPGMNKRRFDKSRVRRVVAAAMPVRMLPPEPFQRQSAVADRRASVRGVGRRQRHGARAGR